MKYVKHLLTSNLFLFFVAALFAQQSTVNVRLYGGSAPFTNSQWNNWNIGTTAFSSPMTSGVFKYSDGSASSIYASLSLQSGLYDNGASYGQNATMCPDSVLRFASYITSTRTLTIGGLDNASKYNIELYASRPVTSGQITKFSIGTQSLNVATDNNISNVAAFSSIAPSGGSIVVTISRVVTYNYINGFKITRVTSNTPAPPSVLAGANQIITVPANSVTLTGSAAQGSSPIVSTAWSQVSGPNTATLQTPANLSTVVSNLVQGIYIFRLLAVDANGLRDSSSLSVIVNPLVTGPRKHIVLLGSSTAAGFFNGLWPIDSCYARQLQRYYQQAGIVDTVYMLAANGANPYQAMPSWYTPDNSLQPPASFTYDPNRNITRGLTLHPDVILCHFPTNAFDVLTMPQIMFAFRTIKASADSAGVPIFFIGTQPRGNLSVANRQKLVDINDSLIAAFGSHAISYFDSVTTAPGSLYMNPALALDNDSIHMNPKGHDIIFRQIVNANIFAVPPVVNAGPDQTIRLPYNSTSLNGTVNPVVPTAWSESSGPNTAVIQTPGALSTKVANLIAGVYVFKLTGMNSLGASSSSNVQVTVLASLPLVVDAGDNQTVLPPGSSAALSGKVTAGSGGPVASLLWSQRSGPNAASIVSAASLNTQVNGLIAGTYLFRLTSTDSAGDKAYDSVFVYVTSVPVQPPVQPGSGQVINVRLFGGTAPFMNSQWNNWNVGNTAFQTPSISGLFKYADGSASTVSASLSIQSGLSDNGAGYTQTATMCPDSALRFASYSTSARKLTISGLDDTSGYNLELYASKSGTSGQITKFDIDTLSLSISTDNNGSAAAAFSALASSHGNIVITLSSVVNYNYLNGFKITRVPGTTPPNDSTNHGTPDSTNNGTPGNANPGDSLKIQIFPNPVTSTLNIVRKGDNPLLIEVFDLTGRRLIAYEESDAIHQVNMSGLKNGAYVLMVTDKKTGQISRKIIIKM